MENSDQRPREAVVSGLGPNGVAAALELLNRGYRVTAVEKRANYTRPIHLHLRATYLADVQRLSPELHRRLMEIATPIVENSRTGESDQAPLRDRRNRPREGEACPIWSRITAPLERHVRLDSAETLYYEYLEELAAAPSSRLTIRRGSVLSLKQGDDGYYRVRLQTADEVEELGIPELVVIAEGGKSTTVQELGLESVRFSYPKYFMSAHVEVPFGPRTLRIDTDVRQLVDDPGVASTEVSLWASGHGDAQEGTWVVIEVPEELLSQDSDEAEDYFVRGAALLMSDVSGELTIEQLRGKVQATHEKGALLSRERGGNEPGMKATFAGTFKFEQQCLRYPAAGQNVVVLGDAAGMGHHALSSGLEMGACDLVPLGRLCEDLSVSADSAIRAYAEAVFQSRIRLLGLGMNEYYPSSAAGRLSILQRAAAIFGEEPG